MKTRIDESVAFKNNLLVLADEFRIVLDQNQGGYCCVWLITSIIGTWGLSVAVSEVHDYAVPSSSTVIIFKAFTASLSYPYFSRAHSMMLSFSVSLSFLFFIAYSISSLNFTIALISGYCSPCAICFCRSRFHTACSTTAKRLLVVAREECCHWWQGSEMDLDKQFVFSERFSKISPLDQLAVPIQKWMKLWFVRKYWKKLYLFSLIKWKSI